MTEESPRKQRPRKRKREMRDSLTMRIQPELKTILDQLAEAHGIDLSGIVRSALWYYVSSVQNQHIKALGATYTAGISLQLTPKGYRPFRVVENRWEEVEVSPDQLPRFVEYSGVSARFWGVNEDD